MNTYTTPECPKCKSLNVFRAWNQKKRCDDGVCRSCFYKADFEKFITAGEASATWGKEFSKHDYYERITV